MPLRDWEQYFKPQLRSSGQKLIQQDKLAVRSPSDTEILAYFRGSAGTKASLKCQSVADSEIIATCSCPQSKKGSFCKHLWALLIFAHEKHPDFFEGKTEMRLRATELPEAQQEDEESEPSEFAKQQKQKQADYRKQQYQQQKQRLKTFNQARKSNSKLNARVGVGNFSEEVEIALEYFLKNGFSLRDSLSKAEVSAAMKKLARVFHPDLGGSHEEILELNKYAEILSKAAKT